MLKKLQWLTLCLALSLSSFASDKLISTASKHSFEDTANNLEKVLLNNGMTIFARIPHSNDAQKIGIELQPMELIIFGNPKVGSKLMQCASSIAIDLPLKALVWQDKNDKVWISYHDPEYFKEQHKMIDCDVQLTNVSGALKKLTAAAAN